MVAAETSPTAGLIVVTGPSRSGKSRWAEYLAGQHPGPVVYLATGQPPGEDGSWSKRVADHRERRPEDWRLACQALVQRSAIVLTKPQTGLPDRDGKIAAARAQELPAGPTAWPVVEVDEDDADESADAGVVSSAEAGVELDAATPGDEG